MKLRFLPPIAALVLALSFSGCSINTYTVSDTGSSSTVRCANSVWRDLLHHYRNDDSVRHLIFVRCPEQGSHANVQVYAKGDDNVWTIICDAPAYIGLNGYSMDMHEGAAASPVGNYGIGKAFGIKENPGTTLPYVHITADTYAVDTDNRFYNSIVEATSDTVPREGEHMIEYSPEYNYGFVIEYNPECVYGAGSNIFMHCKGAHPYTGGCVAVDENIMKMLLQVVMPNDRVCIYPLYKADD